MAGQVTADYVHRDKMATPGDLLVTQNAQLKWTNIAMREKPVPAAIDVLARNFVRNSSDACDLGFVILHRCGESFYFLLVSTWRNNNELWETVYAKENAAEEDFKPFTFTTSHRGTYCIWELGVVSHEQQAWKRFVVSDRQAGDVSKYLNDQYEGFV